MGVSLYMIRFSCYTDEELPYFWGLAGWLVVFGYFFGWSHFWTWVGVDIYI